MAIRSGLGSSLGVSTEATFGAFAAPTKFFEFNSETMKLQKTTIQGGGMAAGRFAQLGSRRVLTAQDGGGDVTMEVPNKGFGVWLQHLMGGSAVPVQQATSTAYLQTHVVADNFGKSLTAQMGIPDLATGTSNPYTFLGGKVVDVDLTCGVQEILVAKFTLDFRQVIENQVLAAPAYATGMSPFHGGQMAVKIGAFGSETVAPGIKRVALKLTRAQKMDRTYAGAAGLKAEPVMNNYFKVSGTIEADYLDKTVFADRVASDAGASLIFEWVGTTAIAATFFPAFRVRVPMAFFETDTPLVAGPDVVSGTFAFTGQHDGTNPYATIEYMSTDAVL